jgi:hypothetical protein
MIQQMSMSEDSANRWKRDLTIAIVSSLLTSFGGCLIQSQNSKARLREAYIRELSQHESTIMMMSEKETDYWTVPFTNTCPVLAKVAVSYEALDGQIEVVGWIPIKSQDTQTLIWTRKRKAAWFAVQATANGFKWNVGAPAATRLVNNYFFRYVANDEFYDRWYSLPR